MENKENTNLPLISVIMGVYNGEKYISNCIDSILSQTYTNIELIIINDGSIDNSLNILNKYKQIDTRIKFFTQENHGVSHSRNVGIKKSSGDYIIIVDQDDYLHPTCIEYLYQILVSTSADCSVTNKVLSFCGDKPTFAVDDDKKVSVISGSEAAKDMLLYKFKIGPWNKLFRKGNIIEKNIYFVEDFFCGEGFAFSVEYFFKSEKVAVGNKAIYYYRVDNNTSGTSSFSTYKLKSSLNAINYMRNITKNSLSENIYNFANWKTCTDFILTLYLCGKEKHKDEWIFLCDECHKKAKYAFKIKARPRDIIRAILFSISSKFACFILSKIIIKKTNGKFKRVRK